MSTGAVHTERAMEDAFEAGLLARGWTKGAPAAFDRTRAMDTGELFAFLEDSQPELWKDLRAQHGAQLEASFLTVLEKYLESHGTLTVLRQGVKFYGRKVDLAFFRPAHSLNPEAAERYAKNRLVENAYRTGAYQVSAFSDRPFDDPQLLEAAKRIEDDPMPAGLESGG